MTTLYKPVLIESAEQAEALPVGTPVLEVLTDPGEDERVVGADFIDDGFDEDLTPGSNFHHVALVPVEAVEETREPPTRVEERPESAYLQPVQQVRYKTRWEAA